jgi:hypothetical protein
MDVEFFLNFGIVDADEGRLVSRKSFPSGSSSGLVLDLENRAAL